MGERRGMGERSRPAGGPVRRGARAHTCSDCSPGRAHASALVPVGLALAGAFVFGAAGAALAVRWEATPIGGLGILGALAAPILTGATHDGQALLFLAIAEAAAVAVLVWRRWDWLRVAAV